MLSPRRCSSSSRARISGSWCWPFSLVMRKRGVGPSVIASILVGSTLGAAAANTLEPPARPDEVRGEGTLKVQPAVGIRMGGLFVRFETTTLSELLGFANAGAIGHHGDAGGSEYFVCYTSTTGL